MNVFLRDEIMRVMQGHKGRANAIPRDKIHEHLKLFKPDLDDRGFRKLYTSLPLCSCEEGLFLPLTVAEVQEFKAYITKAWGPIVAHHRVGTVLSFYPKLSPPAFQQELPL